MTRVQKIEARLASASPGPWGVAERSVVNEDGRITTVDGCYKPGRVLDAHTEQKNTALFISHTPTDIRFLLDELKRLGETIQLIKEKMLPTLNYMKGVSCEQNCDPSVGFHCPECCITTDLREALAAVEGLGG